MGSGSKTFRSSHVVPHLFMAQEQDCTISIRTTAQKQVSDGANDVLGIDEVVGFVDGESDIVGAGLDVGDSVCWGRRKDSCP